MAPKGIRSQSLECKIFLTFFSFASVIKDLYMGRLFLVIKGGCNEGEAEEIWDTEEEAVWPQRQRRELCGHKSRNVNSRRELSDASVGLPH